MVEVFIIEEDNPWKSDSPAPLILEILEANPFVNFNEMAFNYSEKWVAYNQQKALANLKKGDEPALALRTETPYFFEGSINRGGWRNTVRLAMANSTLEQIDLSLLKNYVSKVATLFPRFKWAEVKTDYKIKEFYQAQDLVAVPDCLGNYLNWYHLISPLGYEPYFSRAELLNIPAHQVRELENGWIEIMSYSDPLAYDQPEARARIVEITNYLNTNRHDWQPTPS